MNVTVAMGPWLPVPAVRGGAMPKVWHRLAREFARLGHRVSIFARQFPGQPLEEHDAGVHIVRTRGYSQSGSVVRDLAKDFAYAIGVLPRLPPADIFVVNDFWLPALAPWLRRSAGAVVVCAARYPKGQYRLYGRAARIIAISTAVRDAIVAEQPALAQHARVIPLPVDVEQIGRGAIADSAARDRDASGRRTLLYVGRVHPEKGIELLLHAFALVTGRFNQWRLRIVGPTAAEDGGGGQRFADTLRKRAQGLAVDFNGPIFDADDLASTYRAADLFCYPSVADRGEAFGVAPLEAMAAGVPPIVSALDCFRDFVEPGSNGWVFDHRAANPEGRLADVLAQAMTDDAGRARLSARARQDAARFAYSAVAQRYVEEFQCILGSP